MLRTSEDHEKKEDVVRNETWGIWCEEETEYSREQGAGGVRLFWALAFTYSTSCLTQSPPRALPNLCQCLLLPECLISHVPARRAPSLPLGNRTSESCVYLPSPPGLHTPSSFLSKLSGPC